MTATKPIRRCNKSQRVAACGDEPVLQFVLLRELEQADADALCGCLVPPGSEDREGEDTEPERPGKDRADHNVVGTRALAQGAEQDAAGRWR
jgi:hypothetical protein